MANEIQTAPNTVPTTDADWAAELNLRELSMKGYDGISLTEWAAGDEDKPQIAAGSVIEIDGAIAKFTNQTALTDEGGLADGWCYIKFVVSGADVVPTLTNTFGTWDTAKQGFYTAGNRFSLHKMYRSGAVTKIFTLKQELIRSQNNTIVSVTKDGNVFKIPKTYIYAFSDTYDTLYNALNLEIPNVGDTLIVHGDAYGPSADRWEIYNIKYATRASSTQITLYFQLLQLILAGGAPSNIILTAYNRTLTAGSATTIAAQVSAATDYGVIKFESRLYGT